MTNLTPQQLWAEFGPAATSLAMHVISALVIIIVGWMVAGWAQRSVRKALGRSQRMDRTLIVVFANLARYFVLITVLVMVLGRFGVQTASILAALGAVGLAVGLALQGTLANIASGVMLLFLRPFQIGDYINANGNEGTVEEVGLFTTEFTTYDGLYLTVANSSVWSGRIINYTRNGRMRHDIIVRIGYGDDIGQAQQALLDAIANEPRVLTGEGAPTQPQVMVRELAESSVNVGMRFWTSWNDFYPVSFDMRKVAKEALEAAGITIPFPQRDVHWHDHGATDEAA